MCKFANSVLSAGIIEKEKYILCRSLTNTIKITKSHFKYNYSLSNRNKTSSNFPSFGKLAFIADSLTILINIDEY